MNDDIMDLGVKSDVEAALALVEVGGRDLIDIGCGLGRNARDLHAAGGRVIGVEPDPIQAARNREAQTSEGLVFVEGRAEALPGGDGEADGVFFFRSLHHVPIASMEAALAAAARKLKRDGFLIVVEPSVEGTHFPVMRPFHDETRMRAEAQRALDLYAAPAFRSRERFSFVQYPRYHDFDAFVARVMGQTFNDIPRERVETDEVRQRFAAGRTEAGDYVFMQPMRLDLFREPIAAQR
ncbi:MAG: class I SAM-dependent methyltransferase [Roseiarcus sp.]